MHILVLLGAGIICVLGAAHGVYTLQSSPRGGPMAPTDPAVRAAMEVPGGLGLAPHLEVTLWRAWAGFNLSHSVGVLASGLFIGIPALQNVERAVEHTWWVALALGLPPVYLVISVRYWFREPTVGISLATVLIGAGVVGTLL